MPDDSDDDGYGGYNEYAERDRGYYYRDRGYERKTSPMMDYIFKYYKYGRDVITSM